MPVCEDKVDFWIFIIVFNVLLFGFLAVSGFLYGNESMTSIVQDWLDFRFASGLYEARDSYSLTKSVLSLFGHYDPELVAGHHDELQENYAKSVFNKQKTFFS